MMENDLDKAHRITISKHFPLSYYRVSIAPQRPRHNTHKFAHSSTVTLPTMALTEDGTIYLTLEMPVVYLQYILVGRHIDRWGKG
ncbi:hypothetical protein GDO81_015487 [Engystomops pustulosus]|uniref:Uncharacterized protein n=1 Tax=Engystomops pustulosus TaxID=76066 RepID=A0AAV7AP90_ENGPU|nr:hypothetical protein GDO81_015487 [Engystomops pustulosus]